MKWNWAVVGACVGLGACDGGTASNVRGSGGQGGSDSDARLSAAGGTGGAPSTDAGKTDTGAATTPTEVCRAALRVLCERDVACVGEAMSTCMRFASLCPDYYFNTDSNRTVSGIAACLPALGAMTCTDYLLHLYPQCFVGGKRTDGAGCAYSSQCLGNACGGAASCSTCRSGIVSIGGAETAVHASERQACDLGATPSVGCTGDLFCALAQSGGTAGTCKAPPGAGQPCGSTLYTNLICAAGTSCTDPDGTGTCVVIPQSDAGSAAPRQLGDTCDANNSCDLLLHCVSGMCRPLVGPADCP